MLDAADAAKKAAEPSPRPRPRRSRPRRRPRRPPPATPSPLRGKTEQMSRLRKVIAKRMVESLQVSAQLTTVVEVDVTTISRLRDSVKAEFAAREGVKLSFLPFFAKAAIDALKAYPSSTPRSTPRRARSPTTTTRTSGSRSTPRRACSPR